MKFVIRPGTEGDLEAIFILIKEFAFFQKTPEKVTITVEQLKEAKDFFSCFIAQDQKGEVLGFASYFFAWYSWSGKAIYLDDLYVTDPARGQGIGTALLKTVIELARKEGCKKVRWQVSKWNANAINFYRKMGAGIDEVEINCDIMLL